MMPMDESRKTGIALKDGKATHIKRTGAEIFSAPFTYFLLMPTTPSETTSAQRM